MLKHLVVVAVAAGVLALPVPAASATHHAFDCALHSVNAGDVTGDTFEGVLYGYVTGGADDAVTVSCSVVVNGVVVASTPVGAGTGVAYSAGRAAYAAADWDDVRWCATVTVDGVADQRCHEPQVTHVPPHPPHDIVGWLVELLGEVFLTVDPVLCEWRAAAGTYGSVHINEQGDIFLDGEPYWDCPPYDIWPAG